MTKKKKASEGRRQAARCKTFAVQTREKGKKVPGVPGGGENEGDQKYHASMNSNDERSE